jgi:predicted secreted protein
MNWFLGISSYVITWWIVLFAVLPFGVRHAGEGDPGHAAGAPADPRLKAKLAVTTALASVVWLLAYEAIHLDLVNFRGS